MLHPGRLPAARPKSVYALTLTNRRRRRLLSYTRNPAAMRVLGRFRTPAYAFLYVPLRSLRGVVRHAGCAAMAGDASWPRRPMSPPCNPFVIAVFIGRHRFVIALFTRSAVGCGPQGVSTRAAKVGPTALAVCQRNASRHAGLRPFSDRSVSTSLCSTKAA